ncbi:MAG: hypothetical protein GY827_05760 [Cytophagales bacterium]|nr:hypothetical protein [Cytophagales bacterium]
MKRIFPISLFLLLGFFTACIEEEEFENLEPVNYTGEWGAPLISSSITFGEVLNRYEEENEVPVTITIDEDNVYHIIYKDSIESPELETYYQIQDIEYQSSFGIPDNLKTKLPASIPFPLSITENFDTTLYEPMSIPLDFDGQEINNAELKYIELDGGDLNVVINSGFEHDLELEMTIHALVKDGQPLVLPITLAHSSNGTQKTVTESLDGYRLDLTATGTTLDTIQVDVAVEFTTIAGNSITPTDDITIDFSIRDLDYYAIVGKLGEFDIELEKGELPIDIFDSELENVDAKLDEPFIDLKFTNYIGVPFGVDFTELSLTNASDERVDIVLSDGSEINVDYVRNIENLGDSVITDYNLTDETTTNVNDAFDIAPNQFNYELLARVGSDENPDFFLHADAKLKVLLTADIPLSGSLSNYEFEDTLDIDNGFFGDAGSDTSLVESAELRLFMNNGWPITLGLQGYFMDENNDVVDSLFADTEGGYYNFIQSGAIDDNGFVVNPNTQTTIIKLDKERYNRVAQATKLRYRLNFNTGEAGEKSVKILSTYKLGVDISGKVKLDASLNDIEE